MEPLVKRAVAVIEKFATKQDKGISGTNILSMENHKFQLVKNSTSKKDSYRSPMTDFLCEKQSNLFELLNIFPNLRFSTNGGDGEVSIVGRQSFNGRKSWNVDDREKAN
jgi:hypothetical protein